MDPSQPADYTRLLVSDDADDAKKLPVWAKNLDNAERLVENLAEERDRLIADLEGREQVAIQHELLAASYVEIQPDVTDEVQRLGLSDQLMDHLLGQLRVTSQDELTAIRATVVERTDKLAKLSETTRFDSRLGVETGRRLATALEDTRPG